MGEEQRRPETRFLPDFSTAGAPLPTHATASRSGLRESANQISTE